jgi:hypothetical protein
MQFRYSPSTAEHWGHYKISPAACSLQPDNLHNHNDLFHNASKALHTTQKTLITRMNMSGCNSERNPTNYALGLKVLKVRESL